MTSTEEFTESAAAASPRLRRTAFLLCGDWHVAEDLTQATLAKVFVAWRRISRQDAAFVYATRTLANVYLAGQRRTRVAELLTDRPPDRPAEPGTPELRIMVLDALAGSGPLCSGTRIMPAQVQASPAEPSRPCMVSMNCSLWGRTS